MESRLHQGHLNLRDQFQGAQKIGKFFKWHHGFAYNLEFDLLIASMNWIVFRLIEYFNRNSTSRTKNINPGL